MGEVMGDSLPSKYCEKQGMYDWIVVLKVIIKI